MSRPLSTERVELADEPVHGDVTWVSSLRRRPVRRCPTPDKVALLADWSAAAAGRTTASTTSTRRCTRCMENKFYADLAGTTTTQQRVRLAPGARRAVGIDKESARFDTMRTLAPPVGRGWEYLTGDRLGLGRRARRAARAAGREAARRRRSRPATTTW